MEIKIYDVDLNRKGIIENHSSLIWTRKYFEPGNFELHVPLTVENLELLQKGYLVAKEGTIENGVIEDLEINENFDSEEIIAKGRFLSSYMDRRLIKDTKTFQGKAEVALRENLSNVTSLPLVELGLIQNFDEEITYQVTMKNLLDTEIKIAKSSGLGFRFKPDFRLKKIVFEVYKGIDRSLSQNENNRVIFSNGYDNLNKTIYRWNDQLLKTRVIVGGEGEGSSRVYVTIGGGTGLNLREYFVDAKDIQSEGLTNAEYLKALEQRGYEALLSNVESESIESDVDPNANFRYKDDYDLGDIVTIWKKEWNIKIDRRITEVQEIYENGGMSIVPTFGEALPETVDWGN